MHYPNVCPGRFLARPNRFIAQVEIDGQEETVHVKNNGRCKELLVPGCTVYLTRSDNPARKTKYDLVAVQKGDLLINMDSQAPNHAAQEWLAAGGLGPLTLLKPECRYDQSRFDFYFEAKDRKAFLEVKGVTLEEHGIVRFPDAPTQRGARHIHELIKCQEEGYDAYLLFVIQMKGVQHMEPNRATDPEFAAALLAAQNAGVHLLAYDCLVTPGEMTLDAPVPLIL